MYLTSGAKVSTRRSRSLRSPVVLYCCQSASVSSADMRRAVAVFMADGSPGGRDGNCRPLRPSVHPGSTRRGRISDECPDASIPRSGDCVRRATVRRLQTRGRMPITPDTMALRLSKPQSTSARPGPRTAELAARAQTLLATGDLAGYRGLFGHAAEEPDT